MWLGLAASPALASPERVTPARFDSRAASCFLVSRTEYHFPLDTTFQGAGILSCPLRGKICAHQGSRIWLVAKLFSSDGTSLANRMLRLFLQRTAQYLPRPQPVSPLLPARCPKVPVGGCGTPRRSWGPHPILGLRIALPRVSAVYRAMLANAAPGAHHQWFVLEVIYMSTVSPAFITWAAPIIKPFATKQLYRPTHPPRNEASTLSVNIQ